MPSTTIRQYKAAVVQAEPGWFDLERSVEKTINFINEAGSKGCKLVAFPEVWIPGYPYWMWQLTYQESLPFLKAYRENSLRADSPQMQRIRTAARNNKIHVSLGYSERDIGSLYLAQTLIGPDGNVLQHRRKIKPTHVERMIFGEGSGDSLDFVTETEIGKVGQLNCWENLNPLLKAHAAALEEEVHVAAWPIYQTILELPTTQKYPNHVEDPNADIVTPAYAIETGAYVLAPFQLVTKEGAKVNALPEKRDLIENGFHCGLSRAYGPNGRKVAEDPSRDFEGLVIADIDLDATNLAKALSDMGGHSTRPDLIRLLVDKRPKALVHAVDPKDVGGQNYEVRSTLSRVGLDKPLPDYSVDVTSAVEKKSE